MAKTLNGETQSVNMLGSGTTIKGDIQSNGDFRIDGTLIGSIQSKGKIVIGQSGHLEGEMNCSNADISGQVKAQVMVTELLTLKASAKLSGEITTSKLSIEPGAKFSGTCNMSESGTRVERPVHEAKKTTPREGEKSA
jgi:cytoskeletal protein CcmA (bactofilin family)